MELPQKSLANFCRNLCGYVRVSTFSPADSFYQHINGCRLCLKSLISMDRRMPPRLQLFFVYLIFSNIFLNPMFLGQLLANSYRTFTSKNFVKREPKTLCFHF